MSERTGKVAIVTDSISSLTQAMGQKYGVHVIPIYVLSGTQTLRDGIDLDAERFYRLLTTSSQLPTTSQPTTVDFLRQYTQLWPRAEAIVSIHASGKLSATVDSARAAARELPGLPIHVIDSCSVSMGQGMMAIAAARASAAGQDAAQVVTLVERLVSKTNVIFTVDTLEYLRKGGRIGGATALLGSALRIKPVLHVEDGRVEPLERTRTNVRARNRLLDLMGDRVGTSQAVYAAVLHCAVPDEAQRLAGDVAARFPCVELITAEAGPVIGTHAGPGTLGVGFYTD